MSENVILIMVGTVCLVFIGTFIASVLVPGYQGLALVAPVMTAMFGVVTGLLLARRSTNGNGSK